MYPMCSLNRKKLWELHAEQQEMW